MLGTLGGEREERNNGYKPAGRLIGCSVERQSLVLLFHNLVSQLIIYQ